MISSSSEKVQNICLCPNQYDGKMDPCNTENWITNMLEVFWQFILYASISHGLESIIKSNFDDQSKNQNIIGDNIEFEILNKMTHMSNDVWTSLIPPIHPILATWFIENKRNKKFSFTSNPLYICTKQMAQFFLASRTAKNMIIFGNGNKLQAKSIFEKVCFLNRKVLIVHVNGLMIS